MAISPYRRSNGNTILGQRSYEKISVKTICQIESVRLVVLIYDFNESFCSRSDFIFIMRQWW